MAKTTSNRTLRKLKRLQFRLANHLQNLEKNFSTSYVARDLSSSNSDDVLGTKIHKIPYGDGYTTKIYKIPMILRTYAPELNDERAEIKERRRKKRRVGANANDLAKEGIARDPAKQDDMNEDRSTMNPTQVSNQVVDEDEPTSQKHGNKTTQTTSRQSLKRKSRNKRKRLFQVICTLPGLTPEHIVKATRLIGQDRSKLDIFYSMPDDYKLIFARQEINESI